MKFVRAIRRFGGHKDLSLPLFFSFLKNMSERKTVLGFG